MVLTRYAARVDQQKISSGKSLVREDIFPPPRRCVHYRTCDPPVDRSTDHHLGKGRMRRWKRRGKGGLHRAHSGSRCTTPSACEIRPCWYRRLTRAVIAGTLRAGRSSWSRAYRCSPPTVLVVRTRVCSTSIVHRSILLEEIVRGADGFRTGASIIRLNSAVRKRRPTCAGSRVETDRLSAARSSLSMPLRSAARRAAVSTDVHRPCPRAGRGIIPVASLMWR